MLSGEDDGSEKSSRSDAEFSLFLIWILLLSWVKYYIIAYVKISSKKKCVWWRRLPQQIQIPLFSRILDTLMPKEEFARKIDNFWRGIPSIVIKTFHLRIWKVGDEIQKDFTRNDVPEERRSLHLKFLDEVSGPVLTSKEFKGMKDGPLKVALFDATGNPVTTGPESSAEVEIVLTDATNEDFERKLIRPGEKGKPHFAKNVYVKLIKGEGVLSNLKLGQGKDWTKTLTCRLGARFVDNSRGLKVQNAWTEPFEVKDNRGKLYGKHYPPCLASEVWRLKEICRDGKPCRRLRSAKIETVQDLLFWHSVNPKELQKILGAGENRWKVVVDHARTCIIDDKRMYCHKSSLMVVIYDSVGELKGVIINELGHFVPIDVLSAEEKDHAGKLLLSLVLEPDAFVKRYDTFFIDESSLLPQYPFKSSTNCTIDPSCSSQLISRPILDPDSIDGDIPTDRVTTSLGFQPVGNENAGASDYSRHFFPSPSNTNDSADVEQQQSLASGFHQPYKSSGDNASIQQFAPGCSSQIINHSNHASGMELDQEEVLDDAFWAELDAGKNERRNILDPENIDENTGWSSPFPHSPCPYFLNHFPGSEYTGDNFMATSHEDDVQPDVQHNADDRTSQDG